MILRKLKLVYAIGRMAAIMIMTLPVWAVPIPAAWAAQECLSATGEAAVAACRRELLSDPGDVSIRFALSDAFMSLRRYGDAVAVLREGLEHFPGDDRIKKKLILAESYLEEQQWIEKQQQNAAAASSSKKQETQVRLSLIRCEKLKGDAALAACNQGLVLAPNHPDLLMGRGMVWLEKGRIGNAILDFESALAVDPNHRDAAKNLRLASTKRKIKAVQCFQGKGSDGLEACDAALMQGAADEVDIQKKRAGLLQAMGREKEAAEAYRAVARLNPPDGQTSRALAVLSPNAEKATDQPIEKTPPAESGRAGASTVKRQAPVEKKPPARPPVQAPSPVKAAPVIPKAPVKAVPNKAAAPPELKPAAPAPVKLPVTLDVAAVQPLQYSNAPEVPGITH